MRNLYSTNRLTDVVQKLRHRKEHRQRQRPREKWVFSWFCVLVFSFPASVSSWAISSSWIFLFVVIDFAHRGTGFKRTNGIRFDSSTVEKGSCQTHTNMKQMHIPSNIPEIFVLIEKRILHVMRYAYKIICTWAHSYKHSLHETWTRVLTEAAFGAICWIFRIIFGYRLMLLRKRWRSCHMLQT